jgi:hypothetical protein
VLLHAIDAPSWCVEERGEAFCYFTGERRFVEDRRQRRSKVRELQQYLREIVIPTVYDFNKNPTSARHLFLACVVIFHAIDRASEESGISRGNLRKQWRDKSLEFMLIDVIAHHFKHVKSDEERIELRRKGLPISFALGLSDMDDRLEFHHLHFIVGDSVKFLRQEAATLDK